MPGELTYAEKQKYLKRKSKSLSSPTKGKGITWDPYFIDAACALGHGGNIRIKGQKRQEVEELANSMREVADDDDNGSEEEEDEEEEVIFGLDRCEEYLKEVDDATTKSSSILNVGSAIALWIIITTTFCIYHLPKSPSVVTMSLIFFNNLNIFIAICEIMLGLNITYIQGHYKKLREEYTTENQWKACIDYLSKPLTLRDVFTSKYWLCEMWSTYALYDPSYQNYESFGFFIDFGNGLSTIPPSILMNAAIVRPESVSSLMVGCIGLAMYWQVMYGALVYVGSFMFNKRYVGKTLIEVGLFVGFANALWIVFPPLGIYACVCMLRDGNMSVFQ